jgi:hypothetical protein
MTKEDGAGCELGRKSALLGALIFAAAAFAAPARADQASCEALRQRAIPRESITLPVSAARIVSAEFIGAAGQLPAYCKVLGEMGPIDPKAHAILFQVNLPEAWNEKAVQYGGGGMNGTLIEGLLPLRVQKPDTPLPLAQGYVTLGTDSGHPVGQPDAQVFMLNEDELTNYAHAAYKKTYDAARAVMGMRYGKFPRRVYYYGGSEGGREALSGVQRYPKDYDGVVAAVPLVYYVGLFMDNQRYFNLSQEGGWMTGDKAQLVQQQALDACDALDGAEDGVISQYLGCHARLNTMALRCPDGREGANCLSDAQVALVGAIRTPHDLGFSLANGRTQTAGPLPVGAEAKPGGISQWFMAENRPPADDLGRAHLGPGVVRYLIAQDPQFRGRLDTAKYRDRIQQASRLLDMSNPDLSAFARRGGKLIMTESTGDYIVSPYGVFDYYDAVTRRMGAVRTAQFSRMYVTPGGNHSGSVTTIDHTPAPDKADFLEALDNWVEKGIAPGDLMAASYTSGANPQVVATRPICRYPTYPHFNGGDWKRGRNFTCRRLPGHR